jgi:DNA-3-methyladenine glycosylase I
MSKTVDGLIVGEDNVTRCWWPAEDQQYLNYHDTEWGYPVADDRHLFEKICLEGFQAGLSWLTILRKRDNFRKAFDNFDYLKIVKYDESKIEELLQNAGIIRHRGKIEATINNAIQAQKIIDEFGSLSAYFWSFEPENKSRPNRFDYKTLSLLGQTPESVVMSKDLKKRGWKFVGPTTCYAFMQSMGIVNDHLERCHCRIKATEERKQFKRPVSG